MLRIDKILRNYHIRATDGNIGRIDDFLFDGDQWIVRYTVVDTSGWLPGRRVLLIPDVLDEPSAEGKLLPVDLSREQVRNSPDITTDRPVSRQKEIDLFEYYGWSPYWGAGHAGFKHPVMPDVEPDKQELSGAPTPGDPHLRSMREVEGYLVNAEDGPVGHVEGFIIDDQQWIVRYMMVDTGKWIFGRKVLIATDWIKRINWNDRAVRIHCSQHEVKESPEYDPGEPINREYEVQLYDFYGRPKYWR